MRLVSVIAATFVVAACQPAVTETAAPEADTTEATGSADAAATDAAMPDASSDPEAFVRNIYSAMAGGELAPLGEEGEVLWTTAAWNDLEAARAIGVEVGDDPFCRCQDPTGLTVQSVDVTETGPGRGTACAPRPRAPRPRPRRRPRPSSAWRPRPPTRRSAPRGP